MAQRALGEALFPKPDQQSPTISQLSFSADIPLFWKQAFAPCFIDLVGEIISHEGTMNLKFYNKNKGEIKKLGDV
jgi:hypothetical protein